MSHREDGRFVSRPAPRFAAGILALGVHVLFVLLLVFGVSWQTRHPAPVTVDLWESLPQPTTPSPPPRAPAVPPAPEPPAPPQPAREPVIKEEPAPPKTPDIALEKKRAEAERVNKARAAEELARAEAAKAAQEKAAQEKAAREKKAAEQKKRELLRQMEEDEAMRQMADEEAANQTRLLKQAEAKAAASARQSEIARLVGHHRDLISAKVRGNTRLPDNLTGNPEVRCLVRLLPTGEVQSVRVTRSSGNAAYDEAVKRAIEKSSPLPLPADRDARAEFVPELSFVHRPKE